MRKWKCPPWGGQSSSGLCSHPAGHPLVGPDPALSASKKLGNGRTRGRALQQGGQRGQLSTQHGAPGRLSDGSAQESISCHPLRVRAAGDVSIPAITPGYPLPALPALEPPPRRAVEQGHTGASGQETSRSLETRRQRQRSRWERGSMDSPVSLPGLCRSLPPPRRSPPVPGLVLSSARC